MTDEAAIDWVWDCGCDKLWGLWRQDNERWNMGYLSSAKKWSFFHPRIYPSLDNGPTTGERENLG